MCFSDLDDEKTRQRELSSLLECLQELRLSTGILLTKNYEETIHSNKQTVRCIPLHRWLLDG